MTYDAATRVSNNQSLVGALGFPVGVSTSSIKIIGNLGLPLTLAGRDIGAGADLAFRIAITQAFDVGVASLTANVVVAPDELLAAPTIIGTVVVPAVGLILGNEIDVRIPTLAEYQAIGLSFLGLYYLLNASAATGAVSAWIPLGQSSNRQRRLRANYTGP